MCLSPKSGGNGLDWYRVSADTYLSIGADTGSPVIRLPVSALNSQHSCNARL